MVDKNSELLCASDETIADAVRHADPMVLRGLVYQLTGDEDLVATKTTCNVVNGVPFVTVTDEETLALIHGKAVALLRGLRDAGPVDVPIGAKERLHVALNLTAGEEIREADFGMYLDRLAIDPWAAGLEWPEQPPKERLESFSVAVIGAGMGGLGVAAQLKRAGIPFTVLEKGDGVGGVWYWNRYPGARVDSASRTYTHTFAADYLQASEHCPQEENERYFNWVADTFALRPHIEFNTEVKSIVWDENAKEWELTTEQPGGPRNFRANAVVTAVGIFSHPNIPDFEGIEKFKGQVCHTARWPQDLDLTGKRVAVIGSGCSAYQLTPVIVEKTAHVTLFQRTPSWVRPVHRYLDEMVRQIAWLDRNLPYHVNFVRMRLGWHSRPESLHSTFTADPDFHDPDAASAANKQVRDGLLETMRSKFANRPDLMEKMVPPHPPGFSRPVIVDDANSIYDALLRDDVTLVTEPIQRVSERGVVVADGTEFEADVIVLATGFKVNDYLRKMDVRGRDGAKIDELWAKDGPRAYLGTMLPGFPNFFMVYGPNTNGVGGFSVLEFQEVVTRFMLQCISSLILRDKDFVDVTPEAYWRFNAEQDRCDALKIYNYDRRVQSYYTVGDGVRRRSATNSALDFRLLWHWLRDPANDPAHANGQKIDELLATISDDLAAASRAVEPHFGRDLIIV